MNRKYWFYTFLTVVALLLSILVYFSSIVTKNCILLYLSVLLIWGCIFVSSIIERNRRIAIILFLLCFFSFLLGQYLVDVLTYNTNMMFSYSTTAFIGGAIIIALISFWMGIIISENNRYRVVITNAGNNISMLMNKNCVKQISKYIFYCTYPLYIDVIIMKVSYVAKVGYLQYYLNYMTPPKIESIGYQLCEYAILLLLASCPKKKECILPIILYLLANILSLGAGGRSQAMVSIVIIFFYCMFRENTRRDDEIWMSKKVIALSVIFAPLLMGFLAYWAIHRSGEVDNSGNIERIVTFVQANGSSKVILGYAKEYYDELKAISSNYTFGYFIEAFSSEIYSGQSLSRALNGTSLAATMTYIVDRQMYLRGGGLGSCYIAETWIDFGIKGIIIYNTVLGIILSKMSRLKGDSLLGLFFTLCVFRKLLLLPRSDASSLASDFISKLFWIMLLAIFIIQYSFAKRERRILINENYNFIMRRLSKHKK